MADYLGTSLAFPLQFDGRGGLKTVSKEEAVEHSLRAIIETNKGAHQMEPFLGWPLMVFEPIPDHLAKAEVLADAIIDGDDRVEPGSLRVEVGLSDTGETPVAVAYNTRIDATERALQHGYRVLDE